MNTGASAITDLVNCVQASPTNDFWRRHYSYGIDLRVPKTVYGLYFYAVASSITPTGWQSTGHDSVKVFKSNDNSAWTEIAQFDGPPLDSLIFECGRSRINFGGSHTARYFKIVMVDIKPNLAWSPGGVAIKIAEIDPILTPLVTTTTTSSTSTTSTVSTLSTTTSSSSTASTLSTVSTISTVSTLTSTTSSTVSTYPGETTHSTTSSTASTVSTISTISTLSTTSSSTSTFSTTVSTLSTLSTVSSTSSTTTSCSTTTTTTVPPCPLTGFTFEVDYPDEPFTFNESNWANRTLRLVIPASRLRASGSSIMIHLGWLGLNYEISKAYVGHAASSGHAYDFDGSQVQMLWSGSPGVTITSPGLWSDQITFALDSNKNIVVAIHFVDNGIPRGPDDPDLIGYWIDGDDAATTDTIDYSLCPSPSAIRALEVICAATDITTTTSTTVSTTTSSTVSIVTTTSSSSSSTTTQSSTVTTTTSGPYWTWYQDKPVLLVTPNWTGPIDQQIDDPTRLSRWYGKEYSFGHYREGEYILQIEFLRDGLEEIRSLYDFFDLNRGRLGAFWFPTWSTDILVTSPFGAGDTVLSVEDFKWTDDYEFSSVAQYLFFSFPDGTYKIRKLISAGSSSITIDQAIGKAASSDELPRLLVSFLLYGRFDQDEIDMVYQSARVAKCQLSFHALPDEMPGRITTTTSTTTTSSSSSTTSSTYTGYTTASTLSTTSTTGTTLSSLSTTTTTA